MTTKNRPNEVN